MISDLDREESADFSSLLPLVSGSEEEEAESLPPSFPPRSLSVLLPSG